MIYGAVTATRGPEIQRSDERDTSNNVYHDHDTPDHTRIHLNHHAHFQLYVTCFNFGLGDFNCQLSNTTFYTSLE